MMMLGTESAEGRSGRRQPGSSPRTAVTLGLARGVGRPQTQHTSVAGREGCPSGCGALHQEGEHC